MRKLIGKIGCVIVLGVMCMVNAYAAEGTTPVTLAAGQQNQAGGYLVLSETAAGMLGKGDLIFTVEGKEANILLDDVQVDTEGGISGVKAKITDGKNGSVKVTIKRESRQPGTVILSGFIFTVDRTVPEGSYDLKISGSAVTADTDDKILVKGFVKVGTPNTQDIESNGLPRGASSFTVDSDTYTLNNKNIKMDGKPYIQGQGYIMVPARYVAEAFGVKEENILFGDGTVTMFAGGRTITLTNNKKEVIVNGATITLKAPVEINDNRTYVPASQLANILGLTCRWDEASKTASFMNE